jgi:hypothetical protein
MRDMIDLRPHIIHSKFMSTWGYVPHIDFVCPKMQQKGEWGLLQEYIKGRVATWG